MASRGLLITMQNAPGQVRFRFVATSVMILMFVPRRSSRLMPGLRGIPAVTMHTSAPATSS